MLNKNALLQMFLLVAFFAITVWMIGCDNESHGSKELAHSENPAQDEQESQDSHDNCAHAAEKDDHDDHDTEIEGRDEHGEDSHAGHGHGEGSDLDKPIEELFAADCEHKLKTHKCDECRYEVGVVKVPSELIDRGLISVTNVSRRDFDSEIGLTGEIQFDKQKIARLGPSVAGTCSKRQSGHWRQSQSRAKPWLF